MYFYIARRLLHSLVVLFLVSGIVFVMVRLIPGDPVRAMMETTILVATKHADLTDHKDH